MTIKGLHRKIASLNTGKVIDQAFEKTVEALAEENKKQLFEGFDKSGAKIARKYRSGRYAAAKNQSNPLPGFGTPDLFLTGAFYAGIKVDYSSGILSTVSTDSKGPALEEKYQDIFGLGGKFKQDFISGSLRPALNKEITAVTGLKFK